MYWFSFFSCFCVMKSLRNISPTTKKNETWTIFCATFFFLGRSLSCDTSTRPLLEGRSRPPAIEKEARDIYVIYTKETAPFLRATPRAAPPPPFHLLRRCPASRLPDLRRRHHAVAGQPVRAGAQGSPVRPGPRAAPDLLHGAVGHRQ